MDITDTTQRRTGLNWWQFRQLRGQVSFRQDFKCNGCDNPLIPNNGDSHLHHINGQPKDNRLTNLEVLCQCCHWFAHDFNDSTDRGLKSKKKKIGKKEALKNKIVPLGDI